MSTFLAIDAGGTQTRCWIAKGDAVLGSAQTGTVWIMNVGERIATERLKHMVQDAASGAGVRLDEVTRTCIGVGGNSSHEVCAWAERTLHGMTSSDVVILGDEEIAFEAVFQGGPGLLLIAGTGSNVMGRCSDGARVSAGGWGPMLGDEGAGSWIGLEALRAGLRAMDRGVETCLLREIEDFWELDDLGSVVARANQKPRPDFSELCKVVAQCADNGDALAVSVLERAGEELAGQVGLVVSKMKGHAGCKPADFGSLAYTGNVLRKIPRVRETMKARLALAHPELTVLDKDVEPLAGALWRARKG